MHLVQLSAHSSSAADPQGQEPTHPWRLQVTILTQQSQTCLVPSTQSYFPQVFVLQWHIVTVCNFSNHFVSSDTKSIQDLWRKGIGRGSTRSSTQVANFKHIAEFVHVIPADGTNSLNNQDLCVQLMASNRLPQRTSAIAHLTVSHLSSAWDSFIVQLSRGSQTNC